MAKIVDITDKLDFASRPQLKIHNVIVTINDEATAVLKILPLTKGNTAENIDKILPLLFSEEDIKKIRSLRLSFRGYTAFIEEAISAATGKESDEGEAQTRATT